MITTFSIDSDNNITAFAAPEQVPEGQDHFATEKELARLPADWHINSSPELWNSFAGAPPFGDLKPVKKFTDRKTAVARIWKAIQILAADPQPASVIDAKAKDNTTSIPVGELPSEKRAAPKKATAAPPAAPAAPKKARTTKQATAKCDAPTAREGSKKAIVLELMRRPNGATMAEIADATGWQKHSIRGFISGGLTKKMGLVVESTKNAAGERQYRTK
ncbi:MAG: DUF3489 domain-containing protein [Acidobacteria bacterium]|nr:DUF3489 domain-containing protein [Acidobacteriota bacterium]